MKNLLKVLGVIAFVTVIGFSFAACGNGTTDSGLNGTWVSGQERITLSGNSLTFYVGSTPFMRGTFSTSGNTITVTITGVHGDGMNAESGLNFFESKWYSRADFAAMGASDEELNEMFTTETSTYSLSGDTLIVDGGTYTRQ